MQTNGSTHQNNVVEWLETANMLKVAELVIAAALQRRESRGSHWRLDYPVPNEMLTGLHYAFQPMNTSDQVRVGAGVEWMSGEDACVAPAGGTSARPRGAEEVIFHV